jgi:hypothetical protein
MPAISKIMRLQKLIGTDGRSMYRIREQYHPQHHPGLSEYSDEPGKYYLLENVLKTTQTQLKQGNQLYSAEVFPN